MSKVLSPFVSVIVPVYNVASYIEKCARSLFEQTLDNLEIIFVDDCSPDNSVDIIKEVLAEYPHRQLQTRIIKMPTNAGLAGVRRRGIIEATGDYIIHCDGDDWVDPSLYEELYNTAVNDNADIVICDLIENYTDSCVRHKQVLRSTNPKLLLRDWYRNTIHMSCCNKLIRRSIYIDKSVMPWPGLDMWEDNGLIIRVFYYASKISYVSDSAYHYNRTNTKSLTSGAGYGIKQVNQMIGVAEKISEFFESKSDGRDFQKTIDAIRYLARINLVTDSFKNYRRFNKTFSESNYIATELDRGAFSSKGRFRFRMVRFGLAPLFILMFKLRNYLYR